MGHGQHEQAEEWAASAGSATSERTAVNLTVSTKSAMKVGAALAAGAGVLCLAGPAGATPGNANLSFAASNDGASAGWSAGKGSAIDLTLGSDSATTYALIDLHHVQGTAVSGLTEPEFSSTDYNAGSPRWYVTLSNGDTLWGYPPNSGLNGGTDFSWAIDNGNTYVPWSTVQTTEGSATVTGAWVIADGDQAPGTTEVITGLEFNAFSYN